MIMMIAMNGGLGLVYGSRIAYMLLQALLHPSVYKGRCTGSRT